MLMHCVSEVWSGAGARVHEREAAQPHHTFGNGLE